jgi:integrase
MESMLLDAAGHRRSPATMPGYHRGRPPRNKGEQYPADPPTVEEIVAVMRTIGDRPDGRRLRALIVLLWRAGLRISEALALQESDLDRSRGAVLIPARERGQATRGRDGPLGVGATRPVALDPSPAPGRRGFVRDSRTDRWTPLGGVGSAQAVTPRGRRGGCETAVGAASTAACSRGRDGARRRSASRHPGSTWARQPWHHQCLSAGHR